MSSYTSTMTSVFDVITSRKVTTSSRKINYQFVFFHFFGRAIISWAEAATCNSLVWCSIFSISSQKVTYTILHTEPFLLPKKLIRLHDFIDNELDYFFCSEPHLISFFLSHFARGSSTRLPWALVPMGLGEVTDLSWILETCWPKWKFFLYRKNSKNKKSEWFCNRQYKIFDICFFF